MFFQFYSGRFSDKSILRKKIKIIVRTHLLSMNVTTYRKNKLFPSFFLGVESVREANKFRHIFLDLERNFLNFFGTRVTEL